MAKNGQSRSAPRDVWRKLWDAVRCNNLTVVVSLCEALERDSNASERDRNRIKNLKQVAGPASGVLERLEECHRCLVTCRQATPDTYGGRYSAGKRRATLYGQRQSVSS